MKFKGAFWALMTGMITGVIRMILDFVYAEPACGEVDHRPSIIKNVNDNLFQSYVHTCMLCSFKFINFTYTYIYKYW